MGQFTPTPHPILKIPGAAAAVALGEQKWIQYLKRREDIIRREQHDPLRHGWEAPIWKVCDALLGLPWTDQERGQRIREILGFEEPVRVLLILGGNRASKTEYAAKRMTQLLHYKKAANAWLLHSTAPRSVETHHKLMWKFMPPQYRHFIRSEVEYISYKQKTGFSEHKFVLSNYSECRFMNYAMEKDDALQGPEVDGWWGDELIPPDWIEELEIRAATSIIM